MGKRYDKKHRLLRTGETERADGYYTYRWTSRDGKRHSMATGTLEELREKEEEIRKDVSDVKSFYNKLADERGLKIATMDNIHTVLHQVLELAVEDNHVRNNVSDNLLKELKQTHHFEDDHKRALTVPEQELFLNFLKSEKTQYHYWYPIFTVMPGTGMRVGESLMIAK